jgi:hypothetical protein
MKPTQEKILSAIQENKSKKELLSVQKVDLTALPHFILKSAKEGFKDIKDAVKKLDVAENAATGASMKKIDADNKITDVKRMYNEVLPKLKELGITGKIPELTTMKRAKVAFNDAQMLKI